MAYPGYRLADYWDWQAGWVDTARLQGVYWLPKHVTYLMQHSGCVDLDTLRTACAAAETQALFTANLLSRSPRLTGPGSGDPLADAAAGKTFLLDGLRACAARGIAARWLVLGDALAGEQPWPRSPSSVVFHGDSLSGATEYPRVALNWAAAARQYNPNLAVAAFAVSGVHTADPCVAQWNSRLAAQLAGQTDVHALAFSLPIPGGMGISSAAQSGWLGQTEQRQQYQLLQDPEALHALFSVPPARLRDWLDQPLVDGRRLRQSGLRFWINALRVEDPVGALRYTWAHGLLLASALNAALSEPLIDLAVLHNIADVFHATFFTTLNPFGQLQLTLEDGLDQDLLKASIRAGAKTAAGQVFALFFAALRGTASAQPLALDPHSSPLVWGWAFAPSGGRTRSVLLGNLTETPVALDLSTVWSAAGGVLDGQVYQAAPREFITRESSTPGTPFALTVRRADTDRDRAFTLPPYALALLAGRRVENPVYLPVIQKYN